MRLTNGTLPLADRSAELPGVEKHIGLALAESQVAAIRLALKSKVLVITGGPGVGKTILVRRVTRRILARNTAPFAARPTAAPPSA